MCHWPNDNVGHYLKDWETLGICNRQQSLSSITHSFNQLRSAATKIITWHKSVIAHNEFTMFFWTHKITPSPTRPFWSHPLRIWIRGTTQIKKLRCGLHSCSQDKPCEAKLLQTYGFSWDTLGSNNFGAALLVAGAVLAGVSSVLSLIFNGDKFAFIKLPQMQTLMLILFCLNANLRILPDYIWLKLSVASSM